MSINDISITAGMRGSFLSLHKISGELSQVQNRLASGKRVNTALDAPTNYFAATAARQRAEDLSARKDGIGEAIQTIGAGSAGISAIESLIAAARGITSTALTDTNPSRRDYYAKNFNTVMDQIDHLASDSGYRGTNLLTGDTLNVLLGETSGASRLAVDGSGSDSAGLGIEKILIPPIVPFSAGGPTPDWSQVQSQVSLSFGNGDGSSLGNIISGSVHVFDASNGNQEVQPYAQLEDTDNGTINFYFTSQQEGRTFYATWDAALNDNKFTVAGLTTPVQQVLVNGSAVAPQNYSTYGTGSGQAITFDNGSEPAPGELVQYVSDFQTTTPDTVQNVMVGGVEVSKGNYQLSGSSIVFNNGKQPAPTQSVQYVGGYQLTTGGVLQNVVVNGSVISPANYTTAVTTYNGVSATAIFFNAGHTPAPGQSVQYTVAGSAAQKGTVKMVYGTTPTINTVGSGSYPRGETGQSAQQTQRLSVWTNALLKKSVSQLETAKSRLDATMKSLSSYDTVLSVRNDFIHEMTAILEGGADNLTLADMNQEGADLLMLQTQQSLATQSLGITSQASQSVLKMFQ